MNVLNNLQTEYKNHWCNIKVYLHNSKYMHLHN